MRALQPRDYLPAASVLGLVYLTLNCLARLRIAWPLIVSEEITAWEMASVFLIGVLNDLVAGLAMAAPVGLLLLCWPGASRAKRLALATFLTLEFLILLLLLGGDLASWVEIDMRIGRFAIQYLVYLEETLHFMAEYARGLPWHYWLLPIAVLTPIAWISFRMASVLTRISSQSQVRWGLLGFLIVSAALLAVYFSIGGVVISEKRSVNDAAENTFTKIISAWIRDDERWHGVFLDISDGEAESRLAKTWPQRQADPNPNIKHLVLLIEESFGGDFWIDEQARARYMPEFMRLSEDGWLFTNVYGTGARTVRGVEALLQGIVPVPGFSRTTLGPGRRLPALPAALKSAGWSTGFVYGGWPSFTNFAEYWTSIGFDRVFTRNDFQEGAFETSWGVADEVVLERLLLEMDRLSQDSEHVFLATLTLSNHLPFAFPDGRVPYASGQRAHAMAYADWALGRFMLEARERPWFEDTLFVIASDHGYGKLGHSRVPVDPLRIPLLLYAPSHFGPARTDALASSLEVPKTLACLLGLPECAMFRGRDLLTLAPGSHGVAPIEFESQLALVDPLGVTVLLRDQTIETWRRDASGHLHLSVPDVESGRNASAIFRTAMRDFYGELR